MVNDGFLMVMYMLGSITLITIGFIVIACIVHMGVIFIEVLEQCSNRLHKFTETKLYNYFKEKS